MPSPASPSVRVVFPVSRWTNANRTRRRHLDNGDCQPLCGQKPSPAQLGWDWATDLGGPTCPKCIRLDNAKEARL